MYLTGAVVVQHDRVRRQDGRTYQRVGFVFVVRNACANDCVRNENDSNGISEEATVDLE